MRLTVALLLEDSENEDSFIDFTTFSEFKSPDDKVTINDLLEANPGIIDEIAKDCKVKLAKEIDEDNEVVLFITESPVVDIEDAMPLIQEILDIFVDNLVKLGFKRVNHVTTVYENFPESNELTKFSRINNNLKVLN